MQRNEYLFRIFGHDRNCLYQHRHFWHIPVFVHATTMSHAPSSKKQNSDLKPVSIDQLYVSVLDILSFAHANGKYFRNLLAFSFLHHYRPNFVK